ncbi:MAG: hypothetical protein II165_07715 [Bacteroidales bacterium]|nr:hypothetical protein [Bacteroidales bacterium]MDD6003341.1 hypothetical protein [Bacteroidales bacterium]
MKLDDYKGKFNFNPPEGYFDTFADRVMERIAQEDKRKSASRGRILKLTAWITSAAAVILAGIFIFKEQQPAPVHENVTYEDYATYSLIESSSTYSLCDYFYDNSTAQEVTYSASEFADYGFRLTGDMIIEEY